MFSLPAAWPAPVNLPSFWYTGVGITSLPSGLTPACMLPLQYGLLLFLCQAIGALGLPYVLVVWPTHAFRAWTCKSPVNLSFSSGKLPALNLDPMMPQVGAVLRQFIVGHYLSHQLSPAK